MAKRKRKPAWHKSFMLVLPEIRYWLRNAFHYLKPESRAEAVQDSLVKVVAAYKRLHEQGKPRRARHSPTTSATMLLPKITRTALWVSSAGKSGG